jgi:uncharacterized iron-regulated membrane protein
MTTQAAATPQSPPTHEPEPQTRGNGWFRAFWRWHFYASFLVIPVLLMLAVTGLIYLLRFQFEPVLHDDLMVVEPPAGPATPETYSAQHQAVQQAFPKARIASMTEPFGPEASTVFSLTLPNGSPRDVYVNPWTGDVLGSLNPDQTLSGMAVRLHGELMVGTWGDYLIELGACWAIVMALTGYYLFFKGRAARARRRAAGALGAVLSTRHATVGAVVGLGLLLVLVSGLPWTGFWGTKAQELATTNGTSLWSEDPGAVSHPPSTLDQSVPHSHQHEVPWGMGKSPVPDPGAASAADDSGASIDTAVAVADSRGLRHPMTVTIPHARDGVYSAIGFAFHDPGHEETVHVNRYTGKVAASYGYDDYPALAKVVSQGIALHEGRLFGTPNLWLTATFCLGVIFMCITGPIMWWRRRPRGSSSIGAPHGRMPIKATPMLALGLVALGVFLPFFGLSLLAVLLLDQLLLRRVPALAGWFNVA